MDIEQRIKALEGSDLQKLLSALNFALSGSTIGEAGAFELLAEIESLAIQVQRAREAEATQ